VSRSVFAIDDRSHISALVHREIHPSTVHNPERDLVIVRIVRRPNWRGKIGKHPMSPVRKQPWHRLSNFVAMGMRSNFAVRAKNVVDFVLYPAQYYRPKHNLLTRAQRPVTITCGTASLLRWVPVGVRRMWSASKFVQQLRGRRRGASGTQETTRLLRRQRSVPTGRASWDRYWACRNCIGGGLVNLDNQDHLKPRRRT